MEKLWQAYVVYWKQFTDTKGLSDRMEYWTPMIVNTVILSILDMSDKLTIIRILFELAIIIPRICVFIRRMHDAGASAKLFWLELIPFAGIFFRWMVFLIELMPGNYYNTNFFAWKDRQEVNTNASITWMWVIAGVMTLICLVFEIMMMSFFTKFDCFPEFNLSCLKKA